MTPAERLARDDVSTEPYDWFELAENESAPNCGARPTLDGEAA